MMSIIGLPADFGFLAITMALLGWFPGWRWLYTTLMMLNVALLGILLIRWYRRVAAI